MKEDAKQKIEYFTKTAMRERGWTDSVMKALSMEPHLQKVNPRYKKAAPMLLYEKDKVLTIESTENFKILIEKQALRKQSAKKAVETKEQKLLRIVETWVIDVEVYNDVAQAAVDHYNEYNSWKEFFIPVDKRSSDKEFLDRITVNYLRHMLSAYDEKLYELFGKVGKNKAYSILSRKVFEAIAMKYPHLEKECRRQLKAKVGDAVFYNEMK